MVADPINDCSHGIRVWLAAEPGDEWSDDDYDTVCVLQRLNQYECEVILTKGELTDELRKELGGKMDMLIKLSSDK